MTGFKQEYIHEALDLMMNEGWMRHPDGHYTAWASDFQGHMDRSGTHPRCPKCKGDVVLSTLKRVFDNEGDIQSWEGKHKCGARLVVFND